MVLDRYSACISITSYRSSNLTRMGKYGRSRLASKLKLLLDACRLQLVVFRRNKVVKLMDDLGEKWNFRLICAKDRSLNGGLKACYLCTCR